MQGERAGAAARSSATMGGTMPVSKNHLIDLVDGKFSGTTLADLAALFDNLAKAPTGKNLVVHFHGGLVSRADGTRAAERLLPVYEKATAYPVFFIWNSDVCTAPDAVSKSVSRINVPSR
jgi:hypothetical protein